MKVTINTIKKANKAAGQHFFDKATIAFFNSKIEPEVYSEPQGNLFITSEAYDEDPKSRRYTVRLAKPNGEVRAYSTFQGFSCKENAIDYINKRHELINKYF